MAQYEHLPIYKAVFDLLVYVEKIVKNFSRYKKYTHGKSLRDIAREIRTLRLSRRGLETGFRVPRQSSTLPERGRGTTEGMAEIKWHRRETRR